MPKTTTTKSRAPGSRTTVRAAPAKRVQPRATRTGRAAAAPSRREPIRVLFTASECAPFAKVGGLGDVVAALPKTLRRFGCDTRVVMPLYASIDRKRFNLRFERSMCVHMGQGEENWVGVFSTLLDGVVPVWFIDYERFFGREGIYGPPGGEYADNAYRFALLAKASMQLSKDSGFLPDVIHTHDWPTAVTCALLKTWDRILSPLSQTASVLTIHNIGYQGKFGADAFGYLGIGGDHFNPRQFEDCGKINLLKGGIWFADALTTVSPTHAREILTPEGSYGMAPFLERRAYDLSGILNGADYEHWDPARDPLIEANYSPENLEGKAVCKRALQDRFGLAADPHTPVFGVVSRFAAQKGFALLRDMLPDALRTMRFQLAVLGNGDRELERFFSDLAAAHPGRVGCHIGFSEELSHAIQAGADFFVMPSLYEPCGLSQMYALKYGALPVVRATGGLEDSVTAYNEAKGTGTGFKFHDAGPGALRDAVGWAIATWFDRHPHIEAMRQQAMAQDFSWDRSARAYLDVYAHALRNKRGQYTLRLGPEG